MLVRKVANHPDGEVGFLGRFASIYTHDAKGDGSAMEPALWSGRLEAVKAPSSFRDMSAILRPIRSRGRLAPTAVPDSADSIYSPHVVADASC